MLGKIAKRFIGVCCIFVMLCSTAGNTFCRAAAPSADERRANALSALGYYTEEMPYSAKQLMKRSQLIDWIARAMHLKPTEYSGIFSDVKADDSLAGLLQSVYNMDLIPPNMLAESEFRPDDIVTREELGCAMGLIVEKKYGLASSHEISIDIGSYSSSQPHPTFAWGYYPWFNAGYTDALCLNDGKNALRIQNYPDEKGTISYQVRVPKSGKYSLFQRDTFYRTELQRETRSVSVKIDGNEIVSNCLQELYNYSTEANMLPYRMVFNQLDLSEGIHELTYEFINTGDSEDNYYLIDAELRFSEGINWAEESSLYSDDSSIVKSLKNYVYCSKYHSLLNATTKFSPQQDVTQSFAVYGFYRLLSLDGGINDESYKSELISDRGFENANQETEIPITRGEFIGWVMQASGDMENHYSGIFSDVDSDYKYAPFIESAYRKNWIPRSMIERSCIYPDSAINRAEAAYILARSAEAYQNKNQTIPIKTEEIKQTTQSGEPYVDCSTVYTKDNNLLCLNDGSTAIGIKLKPNVEKSFWFTVNIAKDGYYKMYQRDTFYSENDSTAYVYVDDVKYGDTAQSLYSNHTNAEDIPFRDVTENVFLTKGKHTIKYVLKTESDNLFWCLINAELRFSEGNWANKTALYADDSEIEQLFKNSIYCVRNQEIMFFGTNFYQSYALTRGKAASAIYNLLKYRRIIIDENEAEQLLKSNGYMEFGAQYILDKAISRADFISMAVKCSDLKMEKYRSSFFDVTGNESYANALQTALDFGIIPAEMIENLRFNPEKSITREEAAYILGKIILSNENNTTDDIVLNISDYIENGPLHFTWGYYDWYNSGYEDLICVSDGKQALRFNMEKDEEGTVSFKVQVEEPGYYSLMQRDTFFDENEIPEKRVTVAVDGKIAVHNCTQNQYRYSMMPSEIPFRYIFGNLYLNEGVHTISYHLQNFGEKDTGYMLLDAKLTGVSKEVYNVPSLYPDDEAIAEQYRDSVYLNAENMLIEKDDKFEPQSAMTYREAAYALCRIDSIFNKVRIFVDSSMGNDQNSGSFYEPLANIGAAKNKIRTYTDDMCSNIYVYIREGIYNLSETSVWETEDSGCNGYSVVYSAYGMEKPLITMSDTYEGFEVHDEKKNIYKTYVGKDLNPRQVYFNGVRGTRARSEINENGILTNAEQDQSGFYLCDNVEFLSFKHPEEIEFVYFETWSNHRMRLDSVAYSEDGKVKINMNPTAWESIAGTGWHSLSIPLYYENAYELLDCRGEWYYSAFDGFLYYIPRQYEDVSDLQAVIPYGETAFLVVGDNSDDRVHDLLFRGLEFSYLTWKYPEENCGLRDDQANYFLLYWGDGRTKGGKEDAAVTVVDAQNVNVTDCKFTKLGGSAVNYRGIFKDCSIQRNEIYDLSGTGINAGIANIEQLEYDKYVNPVNTDYYRTGNVISDNLIHDIGIEYRGATGICASWLRDSEISHNAIYKTNYTGIHVGYGWTNYEDKGTYVKNIRIENNYVAETCNSYLYDGGSIYVLGTTGGSENEYCIIKNNYIEDNNNKSGAIFPDEGSNFWEITGNVVDLRGEKAYDCWLHIWTPRIKDNYIHNNYSTTERVNLKPGDTNNYEPAQIYKDAVWPQYVRNIIEASGPRTRATDDIRSLSAEESSVQLGHNEVELLSFTASVGKRRRRAVPPEQLRLYSSDDRIAQIGSDGTVSGANAGMCSIYADYLCNGIIRSAETTVESAGSNMFEISGMTGMVRIYSDVPVSGVAVAVFYGKNGEIVGLKLGEVYSEADEITVNDVVLSGDAVNAKVFVLDRLNNLRPKLVSTPLSKLY